MDELAPLRRSPATTAIFVDFDGTLALIVPSADAARPLPGVPELLVGLGSVFGRVAVVSGRPVSFLVEHLPDEVELHGLYGLEARVDGEVTSLPGAEAWRPVVDEVASAARTDGPAGVDVEHKGLSLTLHFRRQPGVAERARAWAADAAARSGLHVRAAKMSCELHPPIAVDKGTVVEGRSIGMTAAAYIGDDAGDLPAFAALDRLAERGIASLRVAVRTPEVSPELLAQADVAVDGPEGAVAVLRALLPHGLLR